MTHATGVRTVFDGNRLVDHAADNTRRTMGELIIEGSAATLTLDGMARISVRAHGSTHAAPVPYTWQDRGFGGDCVYAFIDAYAAARRANQTPETTARDYLNTLDLEAAAYRSSATGARITLTNP